LGGEQLLELVAGRRREVAVIAEHADAEPALAAPAERCEGGVEVCRGVSARGIASTPSNIACRPDRRSLSAESTAARDGTVASRRRWTDG
jgi:hypothetical protein